MRRSPVNPITGIESFTLKLPRANTRGFSKHSIQGAEIPDTVPRSSVGTKGEAPSGGVKVLKCPQCGSTMVQRLFKGKPGGRGKERANEVTEIPPENQKWVCKSCGNQWE